MLRTALRALAARFGGAPQLNLWVRTAPRGAEHFHWHVDIAPRLTIKAGFELGTGVDINVYPPERAAADLREALGELGSRAMPPNPRPIPRFIADNSQEGIPHGRFAERPRRAFPRGACEEIEDLPDGVEPPDEVDWFPERAWGGRVWVPATATARGRRRARSSSSAMSPTRAPRAASRATSAPAPTSPTCSPRTTRTGGSTSTTT